MPRFPLHRTLGPLGVTAAAAWTGSVVTATGSSKKVRVEPTAAQTGALNRGDHPFDVQATLSGGRKVTLVPASTLTVIEDYSA